MKTGEGKTLVATLPVYLNALDGKGVHVVAVDYHKRCGYYNLSLSNGTYSITASKSGYNSNSISKNSKWRSCEQCGYCAYTDTSFNRRENLCATNVM